MRVDHRQTSGLLSYKHGQEFVPVATEKQVLLVVSISPGFFANLFPPYEATSFTCTCINIYTSISCMVLLFCWKFLPNSTYSHWLLQGHMISNNETVSGKNLWAGNIAKSMTPEGNSTLLPVNVDPTTAVTVRFYEFPASKFPPL